MTACEDRLASIEAHQALFYRDSDEYLDGILEFINPALERDEPVAITVPEPKLKLLRAELGDRVSRIELLDMVELGRNPGRIIPAVLAMIERHGRRPLRYVGEAIWPGRTFEEVCEATRHEALINLAWPDAGIRVLCPYDVASLDDRVLGDARRTHPGVVRDRRLEPSSAYGHGAVPSRCEQPLSDPPPGSMTRAFDVDELGRVRTWVAEWAASSGLDEDRTAEIVTAVNELATNSIRHAGAHGALRFWATPGDVIFQVEDSGHIANPLAGRRLHATAGGGLGLWMVNELCDLVEVRTSAAGTTIRVRSRRVSPPRRQHHVGDVSVAA